MPSRRSLRVLAALVLTLMLVPTAAYADKVVTEDAVGDVVSVVGGADDPDQALPAPDYAGVDILRTVVDHGDHRLRVSVGFRALERDPFQFTVIRVRTPKRNYEITVERLGGTPIANLDGGRGVADCRGLRAKVDLGADTVTTSLPTSCLGAPRWVEVGVGAVAGSGDQISPDLTAAYADDAHRGGEIRDRIALGPKVHRG